MSADDTARENDSQHKAREVRDLAIRELDMLLDQQAELRRRIRGVRKLILALATSFEHCAPPEGFHARKVTRLPQRDRALTEACRIALSGSDLPLTLDQIRDRLRFQGLEFEQPRDPMMSITRVLKRLVRLGEARTEIGAAGKRVWFLAEPATRAAHLPVQILQPNAN